MTEDETIDSLHEKDATAAVCVHLWAAEDKPLGFHVPADIENDLEAWCDECEKVLIAAGEWTDSAAKLADFRPACVGCFISLKNRMRRK